MDICKNTQQLKNWKLSYGYDFNCYCRKAKHCQIVSGVRWYNFWLSTFTWDFINYFIPAVFCICVFAIADVKNLSGEIFSWNTSARVLYCWSYYSCFAVKCFCKFLNVINFFKCYFRLMRNRDAIWKCVGSLAIIYRFCSSGAADVNSYLHLSNLGETARKSSKIQKGLIFRVMH